MPSAGFSKSGSIFIVFVLYVYSTFYQDPSVQPAAASGSPVNPACPLRFPFFRNGRIFQGLSRKIRTNDRYIRSYNHKIIQHLPELSYRLGYHIQIPRFVTSGLSAPALPCIPACRSSFAPDCC